MPLISSDHLRHYPGGQANFHRKCDASQIAIVVIVMKIVSIFIISPMMAVTAEAFHLICHQRGRVSGSCLRRTVVVPVGAFTCTDDIGTFYFNFSRRDAPTSDTVSLTVEQPLRTH